MNKNLEAGKSPVMDYYDGEHSAVVGPSGEEKRFSESNIYAESLRDALCKYVRGKGFNDIEPVISFQDDNSKLTARFPGGGCDNGKSDIVVTITKRKKS